MAPCFSPIHSAPRTDPMGPECPLPWPGILLVAFLSSLCPVASPVPQAKATCGLQPRHKNTHEAACEVPSVGQMFTTAQHRLPPPLQLTNQGPSPFSCHLHVPGHSPNSRCLINTCKINKGRGRGFRNWGPISMTQAQSPHSSISSCPSDQGDEAEG